LKRVDENWGMGRWREGKAFAFTGAGEKKKTLT